jgi:hypothetical protein
MSSANGEQSVSSVAPLEFTPLSEMDSDEKLDEILTTLREVKTALAEFQKMGPVGIMKMVMGR